MSSSTTLSRRRALGLFGGAAVAPIVFASGCTPTAGAAAPARERMISELTFRRSAERGGADHGWLKAKHTFSFARYRDPAHMSFRALRVLNEDRIAAGRGFPMHSHKDMEILTYVLDGALSHRDSLGNGGVIVPGEVQTMSAGAGIRHSEFNPHSSAPTHLLQIWLTPDMRGHAPRYEQQKIVAHAGAGPVRLIASGDGDQGSVLMHQDVRIYAVKLGRGEDAMFEVPPGRHVWVQVAQGQVSLNKAHTLHQGDGASSSESGQLWFGGAQASELLIFDLA